MPFEINEPLQSLFTGTIRAHVHAIDGVEPKTIIEADKPARVHVLWSLDGPGTPFVAGTWCVSVFFESMGPAQEMRIPAEPGLQIPMTPTYGPNHYEAWVNLPADTIKVTSEEGTLPYKMVVTVTYRALNGQPGPMAGFVESPVLQFYVTNFPS